MAAMTVKDVIEALGKLDPDLPVCHRGSSGGEFHFRDSEDLEHWFEHKTLMQHADPDYPVLADTTDPLWKRAKHFTFLEPFKAVVL